MWAFSGCVSGACSLVVAHRLPLWWLLSLRNMGSRACKLQKFAAHGLSCPATYGVFPDWGLNLCPLHWQEDSQPLDHQGSPFFFFSQPCCMVCGILVPQPRSEPRPLAVRMWSPNHWTTRESPLRMFLNRLNEADCSTQCGWALSNQPKA